MTFSFSLAFAEIKPSLGFAACGTWLIDDPNPDVNCDCSLFHSPTLRNGCLNFHSLKWDNVNVVYEEVTCPSELSDLHCKFPYALGEDMPETCASNDYLALPPGTTAITTASERVCSIVSVLFSCPLYIT